MGIKAARAPWRSQRQRALAVPAQRRLEALVRAVTPHAQRHPDNPVPPLVLAGARTVLSGAAKVLRRNGRALLPIHAVPAWAELDAVLQLALADLSSTDNPDHEVDPAEMADIRRRLTERIERLKRTSEEGSTGPE